MDTEDIIWRLAALASLPYQERYVIGGSKEEYAVDTELLEDVDGLQYLLKKPANKDRITDEQRAALHELFMLIDQRSGEALDRSTREESAKLIRDSEVWNALRAKASAALSLFGVSVEDMSAEEIARLGE
jgi:hypothetical protein